MSDGPTVNKQAATDSPMAAAEAVCVPARMGEGVDPLALAGLEMALDNFARVWREDIVIPKSAASVLAELAPSLESSSYLYQDERREIIRELAVRLADRVARCFVVKS